MTTTDDAVSMPTPATRLATRSSAAACEMPGNARLDVRVSYGPSVASSNPVRGVGSSRQPAAASSSSGSGSGSGLQ